MSDVQLKRDILTRLTSDNKVDVGHIGVVVEGGIVTLSGHVSSQVEKAAAVAAAGRIPGVRAIADEIEVRHPWDMKIALAGIAKRAIKDIRRLFVRRIQSKRIADDEIAKCAVDLLKSDASVPSSTIQLTVSNGQVTLSGGTDWDWERRAAEEDVLRLPGVRGVIDNITAMSFHQAIISGFSKYVTFSGRATQSEYWLWVLFAALGMIVTELVDAVIFYVPRGSPLVSPLNSPLNFIFILVLLLPSLAVAVRRLHDVDRTGWWMMLSLSGIGILVLLYWQRQKGTLGPNRFGPDPRSLRNSAPVQRPNRLVTG
jgi:osmotically-inducible protein OsmY/uncharacterized membrane protein YhaH (DUF805 family)